MHASIWTQTPKKDDWGTVPGPYCTEGNADDMSRGSIYKMNGVSSSPIYGYTYSYTYKAFQMGGWTPLSKKSEKAVGERERLKEEL